MAEIAEKTPLKERAVRAMLDIAAAEGWNVVTFQAVAKGAKCRLASLQELFEDRADLLIAYARMVDHKVIDRLNVDLEDPERDRLFDVMMERFDVLNEDRAAVQSILKTLCLDPKQAAMSLPHLGRSMAWMLETAGIECTGFQGGVKIIGLAGVYLYTLKTWAEDDSADMARTMAALDRGLDKAEWLAGIVLKTRT